MAEQEEGNWKGVLLMGLMWVILLSMPVVYLYFRGV